VMSATDASMLVSCLSAISFLNSRSIDDSDPISESVMESNFQAFVVVLLATTFSPWK
jgi:hypothetical protein